jgi:polyhydroxybutyrate depolymerase
MMNRPMAGWVVRVVAVGLLPAWFVACSDAKEGAAGNEPQPGAASGVGGGPAITAGDQGPGGQDSMPGSPAPNPSPGADSDMQPTDLAGADDDSVVGAGGAPASDDEDVAVACPAAAAMLEPGDTTRTIDVAGVQRSFLIHAPPAYDGATRLPVVFDFHGLGGNSNQQKNLSRWDDVGDAEGFITVYPQGIENSWNAGLCCSDGDDVTFVRQIISTLASDTCIDTRRIFASGCSNGGGMSYKLACEAADVIAAVAPVDFDCVDGAGCGDCAPERPITVVQFRGTNDQLVPYGGNGPFAGAQANLATWSEINECTGEPAALAESTGCEAPATCGADVQTILCTVQNGTHCGSYGSFDIANVAWRVLVNQALP